MEMYLVARLYEVSCSQTRDALGKFVKKSIVDYRDDLDLQNLMDYIQKEVGVLFCSDGADLKCIWPYVKAYQAPYEVMCISPIKNQYTLLFYYQNLLYFCVKYTFKGCMFLKSHQGFIYLNQNTVKTLIL